MIFLFLSAVLFFYPYAAARSAVLINEVLTAADTGGEWLEIYNGGDEAESMSGWQLYPDVSGYFSFPPDFTIGAKKFVVVRLRAAGADSPSDLYHTGTASNMGNTAGSAALFSGTSRSAATIRSFVQWGRGGQTWESAAADAGLWQRGSYAATTSVSDGSSIGLSSDGVSAGAAGAWSIFSSPTPGSANNVRQSVSAAVSTTSSSSLGASATHSAAASAAVLPTFRAYAGQDRIVGAGSQTDFVGSATGLQGEPLEGARFLWNFGDGETKEGRAVSHIFQIPGAYTVGLHVSLGSDAASDYLRVSVVPNKVGIEGVVKGADGFVRIKNSGHDEIDVGEWIMEDGNGKKFVIPTRTKIAPLSEVAFANTVTGLLRTGDTAAMALYYPNGVLAVRWSAQLSASSAPSLLEREQTTTRQFSGRPVSAGVSAAGSPVRGQVERSAEPTVSVPLTAGVSAVRTDAAPRVWLSPPARLETGTIRFFWITVVASGLAAAGFFLVKMFL